MRSPYGWIKTAGRGSAYCTQGGRHWIIKTGGRWLLMQMGNQAEGRERLLIAYFPTLTAAAAFYRDALVDGEPPADWSRLAYPEIA
jgi:hypothetical protein